MPGDPTDTPADASICDNSAANSASRAATAFRILQPQRRQLILISRVLGHISTPPPPPTALTPPAPATDAKAAHQGQTVASAATPAPAPPRPPHSRSGQPGGHVGDHRAGQRSHIRIHKPSASEPAHSDNSYQHHTDAHTVTAQAQPRHTAILTVCRQPALLGNRPPPGPPRQDGLDARTDAGGSGGGLLGSPGSTAGRRAPTATTHGPRPSAEPRPSWSRSAAAGGAVTATQRPPPARLRGRRALPYAARARGRVARPAAGPPHALQRPVVMRLPPGSPPSAPAAGRVAWPDSERQRSD